MEAGTTFDLRLVPARRLLKTSRAYQGTGIDQALASNADVEVAIVAGRLMIVDGKHLQVATFRNSTSATTCISD